MCKSCIIDTNKWLLSIGKESECARDANGEVILGYNQLEENRSSVPYFVSYFHSSVKGDKTIWGFGRIRMDMKKRIDDMGIIEEMEKYIRDAYQYDQVSVTNYRMMDI